MNNKEAIMQRVKDIHAGAFADISPDRAARFFKAIDNVFGKGSAPYGVFATDFESIVHNIIVRQAVAEAKATTTD